MLALNLKSLEWSPKMLNISGVLVAQSCPTLCDPMECSPPGCSVHGILHVILLEWVIISFAKETSWPRDRTQVSCIGDRFFTVSTTRESYLEFNCEQYWSKFYSNTHVFKVW